jgi:copper ion binding protein
MTDLSLSVPGISCDHCKHSIEGAVSSVAGVDGVIVHIPERLVDLSFDDRSVSLETIIEAIEGVGYEVPR